MRSFKDFLVESNYDDAQRMVKATGVRDMFKLRISDDDWIWGEIAPNNYKRITNDQELVHLLKQIQNRAMGQFLRMETLETGGQPFSTDLSTWMRVPKKGPKIQRDPNKCYRCGGTGRVIFSNVLGGVCFACGGTGKPRGKR